MNIDRRVWIGAALAAAALPTATLRAAGQAGAQALRDKPVSLGLLMFERMDQIDFTGPFSVLSRLPDATLHSFAATAAPVRDHKGFVLTPQMGIDALPAVDVLVVTGGPGQEALMRDDALLRLLRLHHSQGRIVFSVCTGALLCGAAGVLRGRRATTHWAAADLLPYFGARRVDERVVVDGNLVTAAGITAGIDGALVLASLLRGDRVAQEIQLDIQYAPEPPFDAGSPRTAPAAVRDAVSGRFAPISAQRQITAQSWAKEPWS